MIPLFGRTQYRRGAVVLTLKHTFLSVGLESLRFVVTTSENGPENGQQKETLDFQVVMSNVLPFGFYFKRSILLYQNKEGGVLSLFPTQ